MDTSRIGVIFDCDGTLIDSMEAWRGLEGELARRAGATLTKADKDVLTTLTTPEAGVFFHERFGLGASPQAVVAMINEYLLEFYHERARERPGALAFVRQLAEHGVRLSVASSSPQPFLRAGLGHCGFLPYFDTIVSVDDVGKSKREPAVFDRARALMGTSLANTWGIEDSVYAVSTLRTAGYRTLGIYDCDLSGTCETLEALCDHFIRSFEEVDADVFIRWNEG